MYGNLICYKVYMLYQVLCVLVFPLVSYINVHIPIVLCCGAKRVLFANKLSERWCHIIKPHLFTNFHVSKHSGKRVTQTSMSYFNGGPQVFRGFPKTSIPCVSPNYISLPGFICGCIPVCEICEFNQKKKEKKKMKMAIFNLTSFPLSK